MKKIITIFAVFIFFFALGCKDPVPEKIPGAKEHQLKKQAAVERAGGDESAAEDVEFVWPPRLADDNVAENILTKNYIVVMDNSGSMEQSKCSGGNTKSDAGKVALAEFVKHVPDDANLGLIKFPVFTNDKYSVLVPLGTRNRQMFLDHANSMTPEGGTPLTEAVAGAYAELTAQAERQLGYGEYTMVIVTDGAADHVGPLATHVSFIADNTPIVVYTIGFCIGGQHTLNREDLVYREAGDPAELASALKGVLAESEDFQVMDFEE
ncbi:VWA domain-containing protein [Candidatus Kuenenbacteria bacterium]|nr:VWA domain-containing protein [Candidatus Kuenenbacteria bacterium]